jgi:hypothetical protein
MRENFFKELLVKMLYLKENEVDEFLIRYKVFLRKEQKKHNQLTERMVAQGLALILQDIRQKRGEQKQKKVLAKIKHKCLLKHWEKFLELHKLELGAKRMEKYFKDTLHCKITFPTLQKAINLLRESENG